MHRYKNFNELNSRGENKMNKQITSPAINFLFDLTSIAPL